MNVKNKVILITGGSSGIGKKTAEMLIGLGAKVAITGLNKDKLELVSNKMGAVGIVSNVQSDEDISNTFLKVESQLGSIDIIINNAGIGLHKPIEQLERSDFENVFQTNVFGLAMMSKVAASYFKKNGKGTLINIGSSSALKGYQTGSVYAASKFAVRGLTQSLQAELRPHNIRVILVNPSEVPTAFGDPNRIERTDNPKKLSTKEIAHTIISAITMDERGMIPEVNIWATNPW